jgi:hypothetical protein
MTDNEYIEISDALMTEEERVLYANLRGRHDQALAELQEIKKHEVELEKKREQDTDYDPPTDPEYEGDDSLLKQMKYIHAIEDQLEDFKLMVYKPMPQDFKLVPEEAQIIENYRSMRKTLLLARRYKDRGDMKGRYDCSVESQLIRNEIFELLRRSHSRHPNSWDD